MAQVLNLSPPLRSPITSFSPPLVNASLSRTSSLPQKQTTPDWNSLQQKLKCKGRCYCLFSGNRKQDQAKKALEGALGGKKIEFERWNKEIQKREEMDGGGGSGGGGWFGWFGGSNGDHFWQEAKQASLAILGLIFMYLVIAKGEVLLAIIFNPLLFALRGTRNVLTYLTEFVSRTVSPGRPLAVPADIPAELPIRLTAKESVIKKWGSD